MSTPAPGTFVPSIFSFESKQLRIVVIDGEPWFVAADVCAILNLDNPTKAVSALDEDEKTLTSIQGIHANAGNPNVNIINESGLYTLILRCRDAVKPGSLLHRFRKKVTSEILPAIRKTGKYEASSVQPQGELLQPIDLRDGLRKMDRIIGYCFRLLPAHDHILIEDLGNGHRDMSLSGIYFDDNAHALRALVFCAAHLAQDRGCNHDSQIRTAQSRRRRTRPSKTRTRNPYRNSSSHPPH